MAKYSIAVTGGIGSGKSFASDIIKSLGYQTFSCDEIAKNMYDDENLKSAVINLFGEKILDSNGNISKKNLADIVFSDKAALKKLNDLTHPYIVKTLFDNIKNAGGVVVSEVPVLFESGLQNDFDEVFIIKRDLKSRIDSVVKRSAMTEEAVTARINSQFDYETGLHALIKESESRLKSGLFSPVYTIIYNDGDSSSLRASLISALSKVKEKLKQH